MRDTTATPEPLGDRDRHKRADDSGTWSGELISVAVIDDNLLVREGISRLLGRHPDIRVAVSNSEDYATTLDEAAPNVVLLDLGLVDQESMVIARAIHRDYPAARVIVMDLLPDHEDVIEFIEAGVNGFILKDATLDQVLLTIRSVASGLDVLPDLLAGSLFSEIAREAVTGGGAHDPEWVRLTEREREVLELIAQGLSNKAIARRLHISIHTVKSHLRNTMEKLTLHSRLELAHFVHTRSGVARLDGPVSSTGHPHRGASAQARGGPAGSSRMSADLV